MWAGSCQTDILSSAWPERVSSSSQALSTNHKSCARIKPQSWDTDLKGMRRWQGGPVSMRDLEMAPLEPQIRSDQSLSPVQLSATPWTAVRQASLSITNSWSLPKLMSIESVMPSDHLILCHPLLPPSVFPSIRVFSSESVLRIMWPKHWNFCFSISSYNEYSGLISFRMDWLDLLAARGTLKSLFQHHSSKASVLQCSAFFIVQLSHPYMTTEKTIALTRWAFVGKVMSLFF